MIAGENEDEADEDLRRQIESQFQAKKRKKYLGPDSFYDIPSTSRARFSAATVQPNILLQTTNENIIGLDHLPSESLALDPEHIDVIPLQCDERPQALDPEHIHVIPTQGDEQPQALDPEHIYVDPLLEGDEQLQEPSDHSNQDDEPGLPDETQNYEDSSSSRLMSRSSSSSTLPQLSLSLSSDFDDTEEEEIQDQHNEDQDGDDNIPLDVRALAYQVPEVPDNGNGAFNADGQAAPAPGDQGNLPGDGFAPYHQERNHQKLRDALLGGFLTDIDIPVTASKSDLLYMALGLALRSGDSNTDFCNLINLLNNVFATPVLPSSKYLLDQLLVSDIGVKYHFYCESCFKNFGELDYKNIKDCICDNCNLRNDVSDLRRASYFVMFDLRLQLEILLNKPLLADALVSPSEAFERSPPGVLSDICSGSMYKEFAEGTRNFAERIVSFHFFVDGAPLASSSNSSIWPLQLAVNEFLPEIRMKNTLLGGIWFSKKQPPMELFLFPFVLQMRTLGNGFQVNVGNEVWNVRAYCIGCSADSGARGLIQGIKSHGGYCACNWCKIIGVYLAQAVRYPLTPEAPAGRSHEETVRLQRHLVINPPEQNMSDEEEEEIPRDLEMFGIKSVSPLINMPMFDMVKGFLFEAMHCVDLGIVKAFLSLCLEDSGEPYYIKPRIPEMNNRIRALKVPIEFRRMPRNLKERLKWKAREYNNFILISYPILKGILPDRYLKTWMLFVEAICLLNQTAVTLEQIDKADRMILKFLTETQQHYGQHNMSFNLHLLSHVGAHVARWGPTWATSAYSFESGNGLLKNIIHSVQGVPNQVIRNLSWNMAKNLLESVASQKARDYVANITEPKSHHQISLRTASCTLIGKPKEVDLSDEEEYLCGLNNHLTDNLVSYQKLLYKNSAYVVDSKICARTSNSVAQLTDKSIVLIKRIFYDQNQDKVFILVCNVNWDPLFTPPRDIQILRDEIFLREVISNDEELRLIHCEDLKGICLSAKLSHVHFLAPLPNIHNRH